MSRKIQLLLALVICIAATLGSGIAALAASEAKPNLVVFISDDHGYPDTSINGASQFPTPNLQRIARAGMTFTHAFAASPSCAPSRAALLTGLMPMRNGAMLNHQPTRSDVKKLPAYLQELGYEVVAFGKVAHYEQGKNYGFDHVSHDGFHDAECVAAALEFLKQRRAQSPLCLLVGTNWPHVPWPMATNASEPELFVPPPSHVDTSATRRWRARYAAAVERFDNDLGELYGAAFERLGSNTLFLHFSDHGAQWPFGKWNLYDSGTRVPLVAVWPGVIRADSRSDAMISLVDVLPTLIEVAHGLPPSDLDGRSFKNVVDGKQFELRKNIFTTHSGDGRMNAYPMRSIRTRDWKYIRNLWPEREHTTHIDRGQAVDGNGYWLSWVEKAKESEQAASIVERYHHRPAEELYDLRRDPHELRNVAAEARHAELLVRLRSELDESMSQQGDDGRASEEALQKVFR